MNARRATRLHLAFAATACLSGCRPTPQSADPAAPPLPAVTSAQPPAPSGAPSTAGSSPAPAPPSSSRQTTDFIPTLIRPDTLLPIPKPFPIEPPAELTAFAETRARNLAPRVWAMRNARPCLPVAPADTAGWQEPAPGPRPAAVTIYPASWSGGTRILLPPTFMRDTAFRSYHGGYSWTAGVTKFRIESGYWGPRYPASVVTACRATTKNGDYIVEESVRDALYMFHAFPVDSVWRPSLLVSGIASTEEGLRVPWTAFALMTRR